MLKIKLGWAKWKHLHFFCNNNIFVHIWFLVFLDPKFALGFIACQ